MAKLLNVNFWKKAYLLEFKMNGVLTDAFTFSVPPENEDFSFPQRKNETKTFGGAVVADYGNDMYCTNDRRTRGLLFKRFAQKIWK